MKLIYRASLFCFGFIFLYLLAVGLDFTYLNSLFEPLRSEESSKSYVFYPRGNLFAKKEEILGITDGGGHSLGINGLCHGYELLQLISNVNPGLPFPPDFIPDSKVYIQKTNVTLSVVVCGDRILETLVMIKSAIVFSRKCNLHVIIIAERDLIQNFKETLSVWKNDQNTSFTFETRSISFPSKEGDEWKKLFKPCASQRLFLPSVLKNVDSVLYVDTDVLFLSPLDEIWAHFRRMNSTQLAALSPEHEDRNTGWYNRFARHPYYGELGVNSGVMLMNLTRMRKFNWEKYLLPILREYKLKMTWGDQDIINIIFHFHPERLYIYDCSYNYRSDHCMYMSVCSAAEKHGVRVLHGSRGTFHTERQPSIKAVFTAFEQYRLGTDLYQYLVLPLETYLKVTSDNCGKVYEVFLKQLSEYAKQDDYFSQ